MSILKKAYNAVRGLFRKKGDTLEKYSVDCPVHGSNEWGGEVICPACHSLTIINSPKQFCKACRRRLADQAKIVCPKCYAERKAARG